MKGTYLTFEPKISDTAYILDTAVIIGRVTLGSYVSIWANAVIRGDIAEITIGDRSNIQDNAVLHVTDSLPLRIGCDVTVGHSAILHSCTIENTCLVGMGAIILDNAVILEESVVGAGALITQGKVFPPRSMIVGSPARAVRQLNDEEVKSIRANAEHYQRYSREYRISFRQL